MRTAHLAAGVAVSATTLLSCWDNRHGTQPSKQQMTRCRLRAMRPHSVAVAANQQMIGATARRCSGALSAYRRPDSPGAVCVKVGQLVGTSGHIRATSC
jgi:hypothetical protein